MRKINKVFKIILIIVALLLLSLTIYLLWKNISYSNGLDRSDPIKGTYIFNESDTNSTYLSIDYGINEFKYFTADNKIIKAGAIKKSDENYYVLYDKKTNKIYGKVIPSYKKIYLIDGRLNITEFSYYRDVLIYPASIE